MKQKLLSLLLSIFASIGVALADECGVCGNNLQWSYNNTTHALTIAGSGAMWNWSSISSVPWHSYRSEITSVSLPNGLTSICDYAFYGCTALTSGTINTISGIDCDFFPEIGPTAGAVTLVVKFDVAPCEGYYIAFAGKYKDHNWCGEGDGETFTDIGNGWYKVVLYPDEDGNLIGRPCMVNSPYQRWLDYHWTADIVNLQGLEDAVMQINDYGQLNLDFGTLYNGEVIYVEATGWTWSSCRTYLPAGTYTFTANLPEALPEGAVLIMTGTFEDNAWGDSDREMTKVTDTQYTWTGEVPDEFQWKVFYVLDGAQVWATNTNHYLLTEADLVETVEWPATNSQSRIRNVSDYADDYLVYSITTRSETQSLASLSSTTGSITIPNSVTSIGNYAFALCTGLTSVTIPNSVTSIELTAFSSCTGLTNIVWNAVNCSSSDPFSGITKSNITSFTLGENVQTIPASLCSGMSNLTSISIPNSVTSIGSRAFDGCTSLTDVTIPNSVTSIGDYAFYGCTGLTSVTVGNSVTSIGQYAFSNCTSLTSVTTPNSVTSIEREAFSNCTGLTSVTIGNNVTSIEQYAFSNCTRLTNVVWNSKQFNDVASAYGSPFYDIRTQLTSFVFGENVEKIPAYLCYGMSNLTNVSIPASVKSIGNNAFADCIGLDNLYSYRTLPPNAYSTAFDGVDKFSCVLHVLAGSINYYRNASAWRDFYYVEAIDAENVETTTVQVIPHGDNADVVWPAVDNATTYELTITDSSGNTVCTLVFNGNGQLTGISFHAPALRANRSNSGFRFNVTGLENGNSYSLVIKAKDSNGTVLQTFSQDFTTGTTALEGVSADGASGVRKVIEDGKVVILMPDGRRFDASGRLLK